MFFKLDRPLSANLEENSLRSIRWVEEEKLIIVIWGNSIELYQYYHKKEQDLSAISGGISMAMIIPFI